MEEETILQAAKEYAASQHSPWDRGSLKKGFIAGIAWYMHQTSSTPEQ